MRVSVVEDVAQIRAVRKQFRIETGERHPVMDDIDAMVYRGALCLVATAVDGSVLSVHCSKLGKRKKNVFEPYVSWYTAYTAPVARRRGLARELYLDMERRAEAVGCRRVKSLAGTVAGTLVHLALNHQIWGRTPNNELLVDSPLPFYAHVYSRRDRPPTALTERPMLQSEVKAELERPLRYEVPR